MNKLLRYFQRVFLKSVNISLPEQTDPIDSIGETRNVETKREESKLREKQIFVGFDFGTSSTKVCYYDYLEETHRFFVFDKNIKGISRYCKPSIVRFDNNRIDFFNLPSGQRVELFKVDIHNKESEINTGSEIIKFSASDIAALYCSHILGLVTKYLNTKYSSPKLFYQFGIPVDHISNPTSPDSEKEKAFRKAFGVALLIVQKGIDIESKSIKELKQLIIETEEEFCTIKNHDDLFFIYPETIAGVGALLSNYTLNRDKSYSIVDIGAGTTDISFFRFGNIANTDGTISVYHSKTLPSGDKSLRDIEAAKTSIAKTFKLGFGNSYFLDNNHWNQNFNLLLLGGGSRGVLKESINNLELTVPGHGFQREIISFDRLDFPNPKNAFDSIDNKNSEWKNWFDFLAVSYGLSYPGPQLPYYNPQVPPRPQEDLNQSPDQPITADVG